MAGITYSLVLDSDDTLCVVDSDGKHILDTTVDVNAAMALKNLESIVKHKYRVYRPYGSTKLGVTFCPTDSTVVSVEVEKSVLMQLALFEGY